MNFQATNDFPCPHCGAILGMAAGARPEDKPTDGQWTICGDCAGICIYVINEKGVSLRKPTNEDLDKARSEAPSFWNEVQQMIDFVKNNPNRK